MITITNDPIDPDSITNLVRKDSNGAVITFLRTTRNSTDGRKVNYLEYEAYQPMAQDMIRQIFQEVKERRSQMGTDETKCRSSLYKRAIR